MLFPIRPSSKPLADVAVAATTVFEPGTQAQLRFRPPGGRPLDVLAIVWRADPDGPAFFFIGVEGAEAHDFTFPTDEPGSDLPQC